MQHFCVAQENICGWPCSKLYQYTAQINNKKKKTKPNHEVAEVGKELL